MPYLKVKPIRTASGIAVVAVYVVRYRILVLIMKTHIKTLECANPIDVLIWL